jgi:hypothetical protein
MFGLPHARKGRKIANEGDASAKAMVRVFFARQTRNAR